MKDITSEEDIKKMVDTFYEKVNLDPMLSYVFNDFTKIDWDKHLPIMYRFWNTLLLGKQDYKGSPFDKHIPLPIGAEHFQKWVALFKENIDEHFSGEIAEQSKLRAMSIAHVFQSKLEFIKEK